MYLNYVARSCGFKLFYYVIHWNGRGYLEAQQLSVISSTCVCKGRYRSWYQSIVERVNFLAAILFLDCGTFNLFGFREVLLCLEQFCPA